MLCLILKTFRKILWKITKENLKNCLLPVTTGGDGQNIDTYFAHLHVRVYHIAKFVCLITIRLEILSGQDQKRNILMRHQRYLNGRRKYIISNNRLNALDKILK